MCLVIKTALRAYIGRTPVVEEFCLKRNLDSHAENKGLARYGTGDHGRRSSITVQESHRRPAVKIEHLLNDCAHATVNEPDAIGGDMRLDLVLSGVNGEAPDKDMINQG
jgi:hypothetical protein